MFILGVIHASNNLSMVLMRTNFKGILEVIAYNARLPLQPKSDRVVGMKEQFLELMVIPRYLYLHFQLFESLL